MRHQEQLLGMLVSICIFGSYVFIDRGSSVLAADTAISWHICTVRCELPSVNFSARLLLTAVVKRDARFPMIYVDLAAYDALWYLRLVFNSTIYLLYCNFSLRRIS
jgi:hypothetical protein